MRGLLVLCVALAAAAQSQPAFEVASVKPSAAAGPYHVAERVEADRLYFENLTLRECLLSAFHLKPYQLIAPDWINQARFVMAAKASGSAPRETILEMLQTLLADRFKLAFHREK